MLCSRISIESKTVISKLKSFTIDVFFFVSLMAESKLCKSYALRHGARKEESFYGQPTSSDVHIYFCYVCVCKFPSRNTYMLVLYVLIVYINWKMHPSVCVVFLSEICQFSRVSFFFRKNKKEPTWNVWITHRFQRMNGRMCVSVCVWMRKWQKKKKKKVEKKNWKNTCRPADIWKYVAAAATMNAYNLKSGMRYFVEHERNKRTPLTDMFTKPMINTIFNAYSSFAQFSKWIIIGHTIILHVHLSYPIYHVFYTQCEYISQANACLLWTMRNALRVRYTNERERERNTNKTEVKCIQTQYKTDHTHTPCVGVYMHEQRIM